MKPSIYLETSFVSYLTGGPPSPNLITAANQQITREWWDHRRLAFDLFISPLVIDEISQGNATQAAKRLAMLDGLAILDTNNEVAELAVAYTGSGTINNPQGNYSVPSVQPPHPAMVDYQSKCFELYHFTKETHYAS